MSVPKKKIKKEPNFLRFVSSGTKIWNQALMFFVLCVLPFFFPQHIKVENHELIFINLSLALVTSIVFEVMRTLLVRQKKNPQWLINLQLLTSVVLLAPFLFLFGRINGPFFPLYLLTIMESFLNGNLFISNIIVWIMALSVSTEFGWLIWTREINPGLLEILGVGVRLTSIFFIRSYGFVLAQKITAEQEAFREIKKTSADVEKMANNLKKTNVKLQEMSALKDEFVSVASHELRSPMTTIKGFISMILEGDAGKISPRAKEFLQDAYTSNDRMIRLVNNMLNVSRIESGRLIISLADIQIEDAIGEVIRNYSLEAKKHGLKLEYRPPQKRLPKVRVDPDRIKEVISNIVGNAINFTPHGHIRVASEMDQGMVLVSVEDTGVGIAPADQQQLFKKFSQVGVAAPLKKGSGLGLYICKMLINEFGGDIWLKSKVAHGTTFYFSLPPIENLESEDEKND